MWRLSQFRLEGIATAARSAPNLLCAYFLLFLCLIALVVTRSPRDVPAPVLSLGAAHPLSRDVFSYSPGAEIKRRLLIRNYQRVLRYRNDPQAALAADAESVAFVIAYLNDDFGTLRRIAQGLSSRQNDRFITVVAGRDGIGEIYEGAYEDRLEDFVSLVGSTLLLEALGNEAVGLNEAALSRYRLANELLRELQLYPQESGLEIQARLFALRAKIFQIETGALLDRSTLAVSWLHHFATNQAGPDWEGSLVSRFRAEGLLPRDEVPGLDSLDLRAAGGTFQWFDRCAAVRPLRRCDANLDHDAAGAVFARVMLDYFILNEQVPERSWIREPDTSTEDTLAEPGRRTLEQYRRLERQILSEVPQATLWLDDILIESVANLVHVDPAQRLPEALDGAPDRAALCERARRAAHFSGERGPLFNGLRVVQLIAEWGRARC